MACLRQDSCFRSRNKASVVSILFGIKACLCSWAKLSHSFRVCESDKAFIYTRHLAHYHSGFGGDKRIWRSPLRCPSVHQIMRKKKYWVGLQKHRKQLAIWWKRQKLMYAFIIRAPGVVLRLCSPAASPPPVPLLVVWWWFISLSTELDKTLPTMLNWSDECSACHHSINPRGKLLRDARAGISMRQCITLQSPAPNTAECGHQRHF